MFEAQKLLPNEKIKKIFAPHKLFYAFLWGELFLLFAFLGCGIFFYQNNLYGYFFAIPLLQIFFVYVYACLIQYEFSKVILTNQRILGFRRISFFEYEFFEMTLDAIQEIKGLRKGFLANMFDYGNIILLLNNGEKIPYTLKNIPQSIDQTKLIYELLLQYKKEFNRK